MVLPPALLPGRDVDRARRRRRRLREHAGRRPGRAGRFVARYGPTGAPVQAEHGSLEHFLVERYCLYTLAEGRLLRGEIHHPPWPLQPAEAEIAVNTMAPAGVELPGTPPLLHFAARQDVLIWGPARVRRDA